jgi:TonB family protein
MRLRTITLAVLLALGMLAASPAFAQGKGSRTVVAKVVPRYPDLARPMRLEGSVRMTVTVAANGTVKSVDGTGGHPLLLKAAEDAISKWKWSPAAQESQEVVELKFHPE